MLSRLYISNYALIDELDLSFESGLTIITGETGAGKSILLGALSLILGERVDTNVVRDNSRKTIVEATFNLAQFQVEQLFEAADIDYDENECIMRREISGTGRSRAFVNDTPVALGFMRDLATRLVDVHSQHNNMLLAKPAFQLDIIDSLAGNHQLKRHYEAAYRQFTDTERQLKALTQQHAITRADEDYMRFQLKQLQEMNLQHGEEQTLEAQQKKLSNVTDIKTALWEMSHLFGDENVSVIDNLKSIVSRLQAVEPMLTELQGAAERAESALIELKDLAAIVDAAQDELQLDPELLQQIDARLNDIYTLMRKHQVDTVDQLIDIQQQYELKLRQLDNSDERIEQIKAQLQHDREAAIELGQHLSATRHQAACSFARELRGKAQTLALKNLQFEVEFTPCDLTLSGTDAIEFRVAFNKNQPLMAVKETASGGEVSRLMLSIKAIVAQYVNLPTIIFDEVDTGVSGDTASRMAEMMGNIATNIQVIAITHLPQVAARGDNHLKVFKTDDEQRTVTHVERLDHERHIMEIARMLSGKDLNQAAIDNAKSLVSQYHRQ